jgi:hypothetical protein
MKLSDIDDMKRVAEEYKSAKNFYDFVSQHRMGAVKIDVTNMHNAGANLHVGVRSTDGPEFFRGIVEACKARVDLLQTKLALYGVDKFE